MDIWHERQLDELLRDLDECGLTKDLKSQSLCEAAKTLNTFIPKPTRDEIDKYLTVHDLPPCTDYPNP